MTLRPFPPESRVRWRRIDVPGSEEVQIEWTGEGWRLTGELTVEEDGVDAQLRYVIECDAAWRTRTASIQGEAGGRPVRVFLASDGKGRWTRDGEPLAQLEGAIDVDLGFTPMTNTLPIRRLNLAIGEHARVQSAWLRFPELRLELLDQTYTRESDSVYRYQTMVDDVPFEARLDTDAWGLVLHYEGLWELLAATPHDHGGRRDP